MLVCAVVGFGGEGLFLGPGGVVLDCGGQGLNLLGLGLVGGSEYGDLLPEFGDVPLRGGEAGCHRGLYLSQGVLQVVVVII